MATWQGAGFEIPYAQCLASMHQAEMRADAPRGRPDKGKGGEAWALRAVVTGPVWLGHRVGRTGSLSEEASGRLWQGFPFVKGLKSSHSAVREALGLLSTAWAGPCKRLEQKFRKPRLP